MNDLSAILQDGENVDMPALRLWLTSLSAQMESNITSSAQLALASLVSVVYATRAELGADLAHDADTVAMVYDDATAANNDLYVKTGAAGAGAWTLTGIMAVLVENLIGPDILNALIDFGEYANSPVVGGYYARTTGAYTANSGYKSVVYNVIGDELGIKATAKLGGSSTCLAAYFSSPDAGGTFLGYQVLGDSATHTDVVLALPTGTQSLAISGQNASPMSLKVGRRLDATAVGSQSRAGFRAKTRTALQDAGAISVLYSDVAEVNGHTAAGDSRAFYVRNGKVYPTTNGWGLLASTASNAMAFGLATIYDEADPSLYGMAGLEPLIERNADAFSEDYVALTGAGLTVLDYRAGPQIVYCDTAAGETREIDCSRIPLNKTIRLAHRTEAHNGLVVLDAGAGQEWLDFGNRFLLVPTGLRVEFQRVTFSQFIVTNYSSLGGNSLSANDTFVPAVRAASMLGFGQSLIDQGFFRGASHGAFMKRAAEIGGAMPATWSWWDAAYGGSALTERDVDPKNPTNYWVDMTDPNNPADGPNLTAAKAVIAARGGDMTQPALSAGYIDLGQQLSGAIDSPQAPNANLTKTLAKDAFEYLFNEIRGASGVANLPIIFQPIGRRNTVLSTNTGRMQVVRDLQEELIADDAYLFHGAETWDLTLRDSVHLDDASYAIAGERAADMVAKHVYGVSTGIYSHPTITSATFNSTRNSIDVVVTAGETGTRFFKPVDPWGFRVVNSSGVEVGIAKAFWSNIAGNTATVRLFLNDTAAGGTLYHVWDYGPSFDPQKAIRTRSSEGSKPCRSAKVAL